MKNFMPAFIQEKYLKKEFNGDFESAIISFDIVGFTKITDTLISKGKEGAEILAEMINEVFEPSIREIYLNGGWITGFAGDAFTVVFPGVDPVYALSVSLKIRDIFEDLSLVTKFGTFHLDIKIGISFGRVTWDIITTKIRGIYYFRGDGIRRANLCQMHCKASQIIFDNKIKSVVKENIKFKKSGNYFILNKLVQKQPLKRKRVPYKIKKNILPIFIPDSQLELKEVNEFRKVVSVFISIRKVKDLKGFIKELMLTTRKFKGYLNKFEYGDKGDVILVLFGAPIGIERPISHAIDFALELKEKITDGEMRIGITYGTTFSGEVGSDERSEYTVLGKVVNLSARLMMKAGWGEILCDESISRGVPGEIEFKSIGNIKIKGFRGKQKVSNVVGKVRTDFHEFTGKMVGRQTELNKLMRFLKPLDDGKFSGLVYVEGLAGIGKSRLVHELKEKLDLKKYNWLLFICDEILRQSFNPIIYFLKEYFNQSGSQNAAQNKKAFEIKLKQLIKKTNNNKIKDELIRTKSFIGALLNHFWKNSIFDKLSSKEKFDNTLFAIKNLIKAVSLDRKVILVFEDIHWIDSETIGLLNVLTRNIEHYPIIIIFITRLKIDGTPVRLEIPDVPFKSILLEHLERNASINLVKEDLGERVSKKVLDLIWEKSEGNPFFIEQIILYLKETNLLQINKQKILDLKEGEFEIPDQISNIIISRIDRLEIKLKEMVKTASVLGIEVSVKILSEMLRVKHIKTKMQTVEEQGIWTAITEFLYIFKHAMIRDTVYQMQMKKTLKNLHRLAGESIESVFRKEIELHYGELALHYENAEVKIKAKYYLEHAGNPAYDNYRNQEALNYFLRLKKYLNNNIEKIDVLNKIGTIYHNLGRFDKALIQFEEAITLSKKEKDKTHLLFSLDKKTHTDLYLFSIAKLVKDVNTLLRLAKKMNNKKYIRIGLRNKGHLSFYQGKYKKALQCYKEKLKLDLKISKQKRKSDSNLYSDWFSLIDSYDTIAFILMQQGYYKKALEYYRMSKKACQDPKDWNFIKNHAYSLASLYAGIGEYEKAKKHYKTLSVFSKKVGDFTNTQLAVLGLGYCNLYSGNYSGALDYFKSSIEVTKECGNNMGTIYVLMFMGATYYFQGNFKSSKKYLIEALKGAKRLEDPRLIAAISSKFGSYYLLKKNNKKSEYYFNEGYLGFKKIGMQPEMCHCMIQLADFSFKKKNYRKSKKLITEALMTSRKIERKDLIFLALKINVRLLGLKDKEKAKSEFITMLKTTKKQKDIAALNLELFKLTKEEKYKKSSIKLYEKIYKTDPSYSYKLILEELKK